MKKLLLALLLLSNFAISQEAFNGKVVLGLHAGVAQGNNEINFVNENNYEVKSLYDNQISFFEISLSTTNNKSFSDSSMFKTAGGLTFKYFYPIYSNDSVRTKFSGNLFGMDFYGINFLPKSKWIDFIICAGVNMGSKKVRINRDIKYKNWIFAPRISSELRFVVKETFAVSVKAETQYDLTKGRFKSKKGADVLTLNGFKYHPVMVSAGIGWVM